MAMSVQAKVLSVTKREQLVAPFSATLDAQGGLLALDHPARDQGTEGPPAMDRSLGASR